MEDDIVMILITGACGFIGSALAWHLNELGDNNLILCGELEKGEKWLNIRDKDYIEWVNKNDLFQWLENPENKEKITGVVHMGAISATTEADMDLLMSNNFDFTRKLWDFCTKKQISFVYASSAATYGAGEQGYNDDVTPEQLKKLKPLNKYGYSKKFFDDWALKQTETPLHWAGVKFFNVYGPNEYHKGRMASMVFHSFNQFKAEGKVKLFKSHKAGYEDGGQLRDFIYIKDVIRVLEFLLKSNTKSGVYNLGTGKARSFKDLALNAIRASKGDYTLKEEDVIEYVPMPEDLRGRYQYYTCAETQKLRKAGYTANFFSLEEGVKDYVINHLKKEEPYL